MNEVTAIQTEAQEIHLQDMGGLFKALAGARGEFPPITKDRTAVIKMKSGGQYSYKYADLADVFTAIDPALAAYGLAVMQYPSDDCRAILTEVTHESGASKVTPWPIKPMPQRNLDDAQSFQAAVQVAKRYSLTAAIGVSTEETIEGDPRAHRNARVETKDPYNEEDGVRMPVGAKWDKSMTPRQIAEAAAIAIEDQLGKAKTAVGLNGVWNRNDRFINNMNEKHDDLFQGVFDKFHSLLDSFEDADGVAE